MKVGYGFWGFLGDRKYKLDEQSKQLAELSTPDGNAFYGWSIIGELQKRNIDVVALMPDRDLPGFSKMGPELFSGWAQVDRSNAYSNMLEGLANFDIDGGGNKIMLGITEHVQGIDFVLWEWRWLIPGRNDEPTLTKNPDQFQPDYMLQDAWLEYFKSQHIPVIVLDLDYKLTKQDVMRYSIAGVLELGNKWEGNGYCASQRVQIPFNFRHINTFDIVEPEDKVIYIGNRYERDWCVNKYLPNGTVVHGNWTEGGRDSKEQWPHLNFRKRLQTSEMQQAYAKACVTPLLAKHDYCEQGFMTARIIEAVFYGCLPLFIKEFTGNEQYVPNRLSASLIVRDKADVLRVAEAFMQSPEARKETIYQLRYHLSTFMGAKYFVQALLAMADRV